jgi:hypothetical protein
MSGQRPGAFTTWREFAAVAFVLLALAGVMILAVIGVETLAKGGC